MDDVLAALRPLHTPPPISWWPPAPGWWVVLLAIIVLWVVMYRYWRRLAPQRAALRELKALEEDKNTLEHSIATLNALLKRYAMVCWPTQTVASLSGNAWLEFLDSNGGNGGFSNGPGCMLSVGPYQKESSSQDELIVLVRQWIKTNRPGKKH